MKKRFVWWNQAPFYAKAIEEDDVRSRFINNFCKNPTEENENSTTKYNKTNASLLERKVLRNILRIQKMVLLQIKILV